MNWGTLCTATIAPKINLMFIPTYTIFTAEVASTVNEQLLFDYLLKKTTSAQEKLSLSNHLDNIRSTLYRQTFVC